MKKLIMLVAAIATLASCTKEKCIDRLANGDIVEHDCSTGNGGGNGGNGGNGGGGTTQYYPPIQGSKTVGTWKAVVMAEGYSESDQRAAFKQRQRNSRAYLVTPDLDLDGYVDGSNMGVDKVVSVLVYDGYYTPYEVLMRESIFTTLQFGQTVTVTESDKTMVYGVNINPYESQTISAGQPMPSAQGSVVYFMQAK